MIANKYGKPFKEDFHPEFGGINIWWYPGDDDVGIWLHRGTTTDTLTLSYIFQENDRAMNDEIKRNNAKLEADRIKKQSNAF